MILRKMQWPYRGISDLSLFHVNGWLVLKFELQSRRVFSLSDLLAGSLNDHILLRVRRLLKVRREHPAWFSRSAREWWLTFFFIFLSLGLSHVKVFEDVDYFFFEFLAYSIIFTHLNWVQLNDIILYFLVFVVIFLLFIRNVKDPKRAATDLLGMAVVC